MRTYGPLVAWIVSGGDFGTASSENRRYVARKDEELGLTIGVEETLARATLAALQFLGPCGRCRNRCLWMNSPNCPSIARRFMRLNGFFCRETSVYRYGPTDEMTSKRVSDRRSRMRS